MCEVEIKVSTVVLATKNSLSEETVRGSRRGAAGHQLAHSGLTGDPALGRVNTHYKRGTTQTAPATGDGSSIL